MLFRSNELETDASSNIYIAGSNTPQKFDSKATLLASGKLNSVEISSGGLALYGNAIYVGAGAFDSKGEMTLYLSKYNNQ